jgi:hypothetical protein
MERALYNVRGEPIAYISDYPTKAIYLWDGHPVAYLYAFHVYGFNGSHLGWFVNDVVYDTSGNRIGFTSKTCPAPLHKEVGKGKKYPLDKPGPRDEPPPLPDLSFSYSDEDFEEFLKKGQLSLPETVPE